MQNQEKPKSKLSDRFRIYSGQGGTFVAVREDYPIKRLVQDSAGEIREVEVTGRISNQAAFRTYIEEMERMGYDQSDERKIIRQLEAQSDKVGQSEFMEAFRITGLVIGPFEDGHIVPTHAQPTDMSGKVMHFVVPDFNRPGMEVHIQIAVPEKQVQVQGQGQEEEKSASGQQSPKPDFA